MAKMKFLLISSLILCNETLCTLIRNDYNKFLSTLRPSENSSGDVTNNFTVKARELNDFKAPSKTNNNNDNDSLSIRDHDRVNTAESLNHEISYSEHETPKDVPTRPKYTSSGQLKHPVNQKDIVDFVPTKIYSQVRGKHTVKRLPQRHAVQEAKTEEEKENANRLREVVTNTKVNTIYTEEGYEDAAYDHAGHIRDANFEEDYDRNLNNKFDSLKDAGTGKKRLKKKKKRPKSYDKKRYYTDEATDGTLQNAKINYGHKNDLSSDIHPEQVVFAGINKLEEDVIREIEQSERDADNYHDSLSKIEVTSEEDENAEESDTKHVQVLNDEEENKPTIQEMAYEEPKRERNKKINPSNKANYSEKGNDTIKPFTTEDFSQFGSIPYGLRLPYSTTLPTATYDFTTLHSDVNNFLPYTTLPMSDNYADHSWNKFKNEPIIRNENDKSYKNKYENVIPSTENNFVPTTLTSMNVDHTYYSLPNEEVLSTNVPFGTSFRTNDNNLLKNVNVDESQNTGSFNTKNLDSPTENIFFGRAEAWTSLNSGTSHPVSVGDINSSQFSNEDSTVETTPFYSTNYTSDNNFNSTSPHLAYEYDKNPFLSPFVRHVDQNKLKRYTIIIRDHGNRNLESNVEKSRSNSPVKNKRKEKERYNSIPNNEKKLHKYTNTKKWSEEDLTVMKPPQVPNSLNINYPYISHSKHKVASSNINENRRPPYKYKTNRMKLISNYRRPKINNKHFAHFFPVTKLVPPLVNSEYASYHISNRRASFTFPRFLRSINNNVPQHISSRHDFPYKHYPQMHQFRLRRKRSVIYYPSLRLVDRVKTYQLNENVNKSNEVNNDEKNLTLNEKVSSHNVSNATPTMKFMERSDNDDLLELAPRITANVIDNELESRFSEESSSEEEREHISEEQRDAAVEVPEIDELDYFESLESFEDEEFPTEETVYVDTKKYPYYNTKSAEQEGTLKYVINHNQVPKKTLGGMEFYDSRSIQCDAVEPNLENVTPKEEETRGYNENGPRLQGLGDKLDCFKAKYFDENPLDNPLFTEKQVEQPVLPTEINPENFKNRINTLKQERAKYVTQELSKKPEVNDSIEYSDEKLSVKRPIKQVNNFKENLDPSAVQLPKAERLRSGSKYQTLPMTKYHTKLEDGDYRIHKPLRKPYTDDFTDYSDETFRDLHPSIIQQPTAKKLKSINKYRKIPMTKYHVESEDEDYTVHRPLKKPYIDDFTDYSDERHSIKNHVKKEHDNMQSVNTPLLQRPKVKKLKNIIKHKKSPLIRYRNKLRKKKKQSQHAPLYSVTNPLLQPIHTYGNQVYDDVLDHIKNLKSYPNYSNQQTASAATEMLRLAKPATSPQTKNVRHTPHSKRNVRIRIPLNGVPKTLYIPNMIPPPLRPSPIALSSQRIRLIKTTPNKVIYRIKPVPENSHNVHKKPHNHLYSDEELQYYDDYPASEEDYHSHEIMKRFINEVKVDTSSKTSHRIKKRAVQGGLNLLRTRKTSATHIIPPVSTNSSATQNNTETIIYLINRRRKNDKPEEDNGRYGKFSTDSVPSGTMDIRRQEPRYNPIHQHEQRNIFSPPFTKSNLRIVVHDPIQVTSTVHTPTDTNERSYQSRSYLNVTKPNENYIVEHKRFPKPKVYHEIGRKEKNAPIVQQDNKYTPSKLEKRYQVHENVQDDDAKSSQDIDSSRSRRNDSQDATSTQSDEESSDASAESERNTEKEKSSEASDEKSSVESYSSAELSDEKSLENYKSNEDNNEDENSKDDEEPFSRFSSRPHSPAEYYEDAKYADLGPRVNKPAFYHPPFIPPKYERKKFGKLANDDSGSKESVESEDSEESEESERFLFPWEKSKEYEDEKEESKHFVHTIKRYEYPWEKRERLARERKKKKNQRYYDSEESEENDEDVASSEDHETHSPWYLRSKPTKGARRSFWNSFADDSEGVSSAMLITTKSNDKNGLKVNTTTKQPINELVKRKKSIFSSTTDEPEETINQRVTTFSPISINQEVITVTNFPETSTISTVNYKSLVAEDFKEKPHFEIMKTNPKRRKLISPVSDAESLAVPDSVISSSPTTTHMSIIKLKKRGRGFEKINNNYVKNNDTNFNTNYTTQATVRNRRRFSVASVAPTKPSVTPAV